MVDPKSKSHAGNADTSTQSNAPHRGAWQLWLVLVWVLFVHLTGIYGAFVFDDKSIVDNESLRELWSGDWFRLTKRPVTTATFAVNFSMIGESPIGLHIVNLLIHCSSAVCLFLLCRQTMQKWLGQNATAAATAIALIWGVHPLTTSAVTYIVQRAECLATLGILVSLLAYATAFSSDEHDDEDKQSRRKFLWPFVAIASAWMAYGCKEMSAGLPLILACYDRAFISQSWRGVLRRWPIFLVMVAPLILGAVLILPRLWKPSNGRNTIGFGIDGITPWSYFASQPRVFLQYIKLTFLPFGQSLDYGWIPSRSGVSQVLGLIGWGCIIASVIVAFRRSIRIAFLIIAGLLVLAPTSTFLPLQDIIFEHRFYFPLACVIAGAVGFVASRWPDLANRYLLVVAILIALPLSVFATKRNLQYSSPAALFENDVQNNPENPRAWISLASALDFDTPEPRIEAFQRAIELSKKRGYFYAGTDYKWTRGLADEYFMMGKIEPARTWYEVALPKSYDQLQETEIQFSLAMIASMQGRSDEATDLFKKALSSDSSIHGKIEAVYKEHLARLSREREAIREGTVADPKNPKSDPK